MAGDTRAGDFHIRYNALHSMNLTPDIARRVGVAQRGDNIVVLVNVQKPQDGNPLNAVPAQVAGAARDLLGNKRSLDFRQIQEAGAIDYVAQTPVENQQTLIFDLTITPKDGPTKSVQFQQQFYTR